jgi:DNA mismatch repair protein MutS
MRQYARFKQQHPGCLLLFRIGDFYEMFDDDAVAASKAIGLTLTQRTAGVPMAGMPFHQLETYLRKLLAAGFRVAVCDQVQDASEAKGLIERAVTRVITPGTLVDESLLSNEEDNLVAAVVLSGAEKGSAKASGKGAEAIAGIALVELSTGRFDVVQTSVDQVGDELLRHRVSEVVYPEALAEAMPVRLSGALRAGNIAGTPRPGWHFRNTEAKEALTQLFAVGTLAGFGLSDESLLVCAAGGLVRYLQETQAPGERGADDLRDEKAKAGRAAVLSHLRPPRLLDRSETMTLDAASLRALEIDRTIRGSAGTGSAVPARDGSLIGCFSTPTGRSLLRTAMGKRLLRAWLTSPLTNVGAIHARQRCVTLFASDRTLAEKLASELENVQDVARIMGRLAMGRATPRDVVALGQSLLRARAIGELLLGAPAAVGLAGRLLEHADELVVLGGAIAASCVNEPPTHLREGGLIRDGVDTELDSYRTLSSGASQWLAEYQKKLIEQYQLPNLKVGYNKIFGYFIELPKAQSQRAPDAFSRRQTLTNAERYITPELKEFEDKATHAQTRSVAREQAIFDALCDQARSLAAGVHQFAQGCGELDVLLAFAEKAVTRKWTAPEIVDEPVMMFKGARHPALDDLLEGRFVPNDLSLGHGGDDQAHSERRLAIITGPNMAGKSTFIRQTALLTLLAQTGSYVPAEAATIGVCDRIFTRVGADDALFAGQSTFMVEMTETASILHHATQRSLVVLDEVGRGTSTLDGLSLAWAIAETLAERGCRSLFATHYHEITQLEAMQPKRVVNLHVSVREWEDQIIFLHRILPGRAEKSFGIQVARLAGVPKGTVARAKEILQQLELDHSAITREMGGKKGLSKGKSARTASDAGSDEQLMLFKEFVPHPVIEELKSVSIEQLSPMQAFDLLRRLREQV